MASADVETGHTEYVGGADFSVRPQTRQRIRAPARRRPPRAPGWRVGRHVPECLTKTLPGRAFLR